MKTITRNGLIDILAGITRPQPIGIIALTDARPRKTGNPFAQIFKLSRVWPFVGADYGRAVNAQLAREGSPADFVPASTRYSRISAALVQFSNGNFGVPVQFNSQLTQASRPRFFARTARLAPLRPVDRSTVAPYLPEASEPARQLDAGIANPVVWRTYGVDSILRLSVAGETYRVRSALALAFMFTLALSLAPVASYAKGGHGGGHGHAAPTAHSTHAPSAPSTHTAKPSLLHRMFHRAPKR